MRGDVVMHCHRHWGLDRGSNANCLILCDLNLLKTLPPPPLCCIFFFPSLSLAWTPHLISKSARVIHTSTIWTSRRVEPIPFYVCFALLFSTQETIESFETFCRKYLFYQQGEWLYSIMAKPTYSRCWKHRDVFKGSTSSNDNYHITIDKVQQVVVVARSTTSSRGVYHVVADTSSRPTTKLLLWFNSTSCR